MFGTTMMTVAFIENVASSTSSSSSSSSPSSGTTTSNSETSTTDPSSSSSSPSSPPLPPARKQHCWECLRRRLVCDSTKPVCKRCQDAGVVCPGYDDQKPLKWLAPGKVTPYASRPRRKRGVPPQGNGVRDANKSLALSGNKPTSLQKKPQPAVLPLFPVTDLEPFQRDLSDILQAACYYNSRLVPDYAPVMSLLPNAIQIEIAIDQVVEMPRASQHNMVCLALAHRIHQLPPHQLSPSSAARLWSAFFHHRQLAIKGLTEDIGVVTPEVRIVSLSTIITILHVEVQQCYENWRIHYEGAMDLMQQCGGLETLVVHPIWRGVATVSLSFNVFGNSTCPSNQQTHKPPYHQLVPLIASHFDTNFCPSTAFPTQLLLDVAHINQQRFLRRTTSSSSSSSSSSSNNNNNTPLTAEKDDCCSLLLLPPPTPQEILSDILSFSPSAWPATIGSSAPELVTYGQILQSVVALYCIIALDMCPCSSSSSSSSAPIPDHHHHHHQDENDNNNNNNNNNIIIPSLKTFHYNRLFSLLRSFSSFSSSSSDDDNNNNNNNNNKAGNKLLMWPLAMAGVAAAEGNRCCCFCCFEEVEAGGGGEQDRKFIADILPKISRIIGQATPLLLKEVLVRFWGGGKGGGKGGGEKGWEGCFDGVYYFAT